MASQRRSRATEDEDLFGEQDHHDHQHKAKLPVIPDLRFEYSYLRSIRPYVHVERLHEESLLSKHRHAHSSAEELLSDYEKVDFPEASAARQGGAEEQDTTAPRPSTGPKEIVHVEWKRVLWITTRDQVISPLLQGTIWALAAFFLSPYSASLGSKLGHLMHAKSAPKEGIAAGWLRNLAKSLGLTSKSAESR